MQNTRWPLLFSPIRLGALELSNRIVMPAMDPSLSDTRGLITEAAIHHYADRARGGAGLVITGNLACDPLGRAGPHQALISDDAFLPGLSALADAVHAQGGRVFFQISHAGRQTQQSFIGGQPVSASAIPCPLTRTMPRALRSEEVDALADTFAAAALRSKVAGADGVEFHMAHGYLVCQFLSPYSNTRDDIWGGDPDGRGRFAQEIVRRSRVLVGPDYPLQCRLSADELVEGGIRPPLASTYARKLVEAGATSLSISACNYESYRFNMPAYYLPRGTYAHLARHVRQNLGDGAPPIVAVGRFSRGDEAEACLARGDADLIAMGRALIADPDLPRKMREGHDDAVRPCVACNRCAEAVTRGPIRCTVNPRAGGLPAVALPAREPRKILVIGGGPAGLLAATGAADRGHRVSLVEAGERLGGNAWSSGGPPCKEDFNRLAAWLVRELQDSSTEVRLDVRMSPTEALASDADRILVAVGGTPNPPPPIPGLAAHPAVMGPVAAMSDPEPRQHVLIIGGGAEGAEVADAMVDHLGKPRVSLVELRRKVGLGLPTSVRSLLEDRLAERGVHVHTLRTVGAVHPDGVALADSRGQPREMLPPADLVIVAIGTRAPEEWATNDPRVILLGDCREPASLLEAIAEGWRIGQEV